MTEGNFERGSDFIELVGDVVAAYVSNNSVPAFELPALIAGVHGAIAGLASGTAATETGTDARVGVEKPAPAQIRKSVREDGIVSFIDGRPTRRSSAI